MKLHPYGPDAEGKKERRDVIVSQNYEEVLFNEPVEQFYNLLTSGPPPPPGPKGKGGKSAKQAQPTSARTAEIPYADSPKNPYSQKTEGKELDRLGEAIKTVDQMLKEEKAKLMEREKKLEELKKSEGVPTVVKKK